MVAQKAPESPTEPAAGLSTSLGCSLQRGCRGRDEDADGAAAALAAAARPGPVAGQAERESETQLESEKSLRVTVDSRSWTDCKIVSPWFIDTASLTVKNTFIEVTAEPALEGDLRSQSAPPVLARCRLDQPPAESEFGTQDVHTTPLGAVTQLVLAPDRQRDDHTTFDKIQATVSAGWEPQKESELADRLNIATEVAASSEGMGAEPLAGATGPVGQGWNAAEGCPLTALNGDALACEDGATKPEGERLVLVRLDEARLAHSSFLGAVQSESSRVDRACSVTHACCVQ